ncbi:MAG: hypothetical protein WAZ19_11750 [Anaerolineae bacterium]
MAQSTLSPVIALSLKRFLLIEQCPEGWKHLDLYLFRDAEVVFYVGQSHLAFARVWDHLLNGFKGHSQIGRFVWANWPKSMHFTLELYSSQAEAFATLGHDLNAAEQWLIRQGSPCFNATYNTQPTPLPSVYAPPSAPLQCSRSLKKLLYQAEHAVRLEDATDAANW